MAPLVDIRGPDRADGSSVGLIVRISDIRRLGAWNRVGSRTSSRGAAAIARRHAMRAAIAHVVARPVIVAAATELAGADVAIASGAICARATRSMSSMDSAATSRLLCAAAA